MKSSVIITKRVMTKLIHIEKCFRVINIKLDFLSKKQVMCLMISLVAHFLIPVEAHIGGGCKH